MTDRLLLAADDPDISRLLTRALSREGYDVDVHANPDSVVAGLTTQPDIIVLDAGTSHPGGGPGACWHLRDTGTTVPVLLLMDRTADIDLVVARDSGADDCLVKPFHVVELLARIHALLPHRSSIPSVQFTCSARQIQHYGTRQPRQNNPVPVSDRRIQTVVATPGVSGSKSNSCTA